MRHIKTISWLGPACAFALGVLGCEDPKPTPSPELPSRKLDPNLSWHGNNRDRLDAMLFEHGAASASYDAARKPVAAFDWDNTVIKNDIGDATFFWMLQHDKVLQPPAKNWRFTSAFLTADAVQKLQTACGALAEPGQPLPTSSTACGSEIVTIYTTAKTTDGKAAFSGWNYRRMEPSYAWVAQLQAGYTAAESRAMADSALTESLAAAQGATQKIGTVTGLTAWLRIYPQQADLIGALQEHGWDVWVVSASPQAWVEAAAARVGIPAERVIGIRSLSAAGKLTYDVQGCGDVPDGSNDGAGAVVGNTMVTYIDGKRCWINKVIYGDASASAVSKRSNAAQRPVFAAGDSDTDLTFLQDATGLKLVLNRNKKEIMCNAYHNAGGRWLVNPMFIEPRAQQTQPYACASTACKDAQGASVPCLDENGAPIPDQADAIFGL
jgi:hypothetical protein